MLHNRLATKSRLYEWGILTDSTCVMCSVASETSSHTLFECPTFEQIWTLCLQQIGITNHHRGLAEEVQAVIAKGHSKRPQSRLLLMFSTEVVYHIWQQRNQVVFGGSCLDPRQSCKQIIFRVACRYTEDLRQLLIV